MLQAIAISGKMGFGKDYYAYHIKKTNPKLKFQDVSFAYALKSEVHDFIMDYRDFVYEYVEAHKPKDYKEIKRRLSSRYNIEYNHVDYIISIYEVMTDREKAYFDPHTLRTNKMREILQYYGTNIRRAQYPNYWVDKTYDVICKVNQEGKIAIVTDARFENEIDMLNNKLNSLTIKLNLDLKSQQLRLKDRDGIKYSVVELQHVSETSLDGYYDFDLILSSYSELRDANLNLIKTFIAEKNK